MTDFLDRRRDARRRSGALIDGADRAIGTESDLELFSSGGRGHVFVVYVLEATTPARPAGAFHSGAWLEDVLATVQLHPEDAVDGGADSVPLTLRIVNGAGLQLRREAGAVARVQGLWE